jgi:O-methyltransferase
MRVDKRFLTMAGQITARSVVGYEALWVIYQMALQSTRVTGNFLEAGVYKGGTARFLKMLLDENPREDRSLLLFDTFAGMPDVDPSQDIHKKGDFDDTSLAAVTEWVGQDHVRYYPGFMPQTFAGLEDEVFAFAHIDVDLKSSVEACCAFVYPRMSPGGVIVFDDYGHRTCPGARVAVDEFFRDRPENPLALPHGQAIVFKLP